MEDNDEYVKKDPAKIKRYAAWAVFIIGVGMMAMFFGPPETAGYFFELLKEVITLLAI